jgi:hypothetical protein
MDAPYVTSRSGRFARGRARPGAGLMRTGVALFAALRACRRQGDAINTLAPKLRGFPPSALITSFVRSELSRARALRGDRREK